MALNSVAFVHTAPCEVLSSCRRLTIKWLDWKSSLGYIELQTPKICRPYTKSCREQTIPRINMNFGVAAIRSQLGCLVLGFNTLSVEVQWVPFVIGVADCEFTLQVQLNGGITSVAWWPMGPNPRGSMVRLVVVVPRPVACSPEWRWQAAWGMWGEKSENWRYELMSLSNKRVF